MTCRYCGAEAPEGASFCGNCGASLLDGNNQSTMPNNFNSTYNSNPNNVNKKDVDGLGIASMVLGILALLCTCSSILPLIFSIIAIILACIDKRRSGMRTAGLGLGIIGLVLVLLLTGIGILYRSGKDDVKTKIEDDLNEYYNSSKTDNSESSTNKDRSALYNNSYLYGDWYQFGPNELLTNTSNVKPVCPVVLLTPFTDELTFKLSKAIS